MNSILDKIRKRDICYFIAVLLMALTIIPILIASGFSVLAADDFSVMNSIRAAEGGNLFMKVINTIARLYFKWSAGYGGILIEYTVAWFIDMNRHVVGVFLVLTFLIQLWSLYILISNITSYFEVRSRKLVFWAYAGLLVAWLGYNSYPEVNYWFIGNISYGFSLSVNMQIIALMIAAERRDRKWWIIPGILLGILMGGLSIQSGLPTCFMMFVLNMDQILRKHKLNIYYAVPSIAAVIGYAVHVFAPGNFVRKDTMDTANVGLQPTTTLHYSVYVVSDEISRAMQNPYMVIALIIMLYLGIKSSREIVIKGRNIVLVAIIAFIMLIATCYTVLLGYGSTDISSLPVRCLYVFDFFTYSCLMTVAYCTGAYVKNWSGLASSSNLNVTVAAAIVAVSALNVSLMIGNASWKNLLSDIAHGDITGYSAQIDGILNEIQNSSDSDVVIADLPECPETFNPFIITAYPDEWLNQEVARYYGKNSVKTGK